MYVQRPEQCHVYLGISTDSMIIVTTFSVVMPSISRSGVNITLWLSTGIKAFFTSSGITKSRPDMAAKALAAVNVAMEALGEAPRYKCGWFRVCVIMLAI